MTWHSKRFLIDLDASFSIKTTFNKVATLTLYKYIIIITMHRKSARDDIIDSLNRLVLIHHTFHIIKLICNRYQKVTLLFFARRRSKS